MHHCWSRFITFYACMVGMQAVITWPVQLCMHLIDLPVLMLLKSSEAH